MKKILTLTAMLLALAACEKNLPVDLSSRASRGGVNIDGVRITVFKQPDGTWAAYGGDDSKDPANYVRYRKSRAIELKSGCRIDKRLSGKADHIYIARVKCA